MWVFPGQPTIPSVLNSNQVVKVSFAARYTSFTKSVQWRWEFGWLVHLAVEFEIVFRLLSKQTFTFFEVGASQLIISWLVWTIY